MTSEPKVRLEWEEGFTLIEVLVAMVILAIGLLALEALGIGAARSLAQAEDTNELVAAATSAMERGQAELRRELLVGGAVSTGESCDTDDSGQYTCTDVQTRSTLSTLSMGSARITVTVSTDEESDDSFTVTSYVFDPELP